MKRILRSRLPERFADKVPPPVVEIAVGVGVAVLLTLVRIPLYPAIGDRGSLAARFPATHELSSREQSAVNFTSARVLDELAHANQAYLDRFGFIFIVCATGKSAEEMLKLLRDRLGNDRATELRTAAEEQAKITALRLGGY